ncbi:MAG: HlyD family efflux transporter periplasmic adaptor subunit [Nitrospiraceae bacterium]|nr:HlyD family efflux transporter periplasmic adaptor subunit [Nitrospiraceae bacterium]
MTGKKRKPIIITILLTAAVVLAAVFGKMGYREKPQDLSGTVEAEEINLSAEIAGRIINMPAGEGDAVKAGEVVVTLEDRKSQTQLEQAVAALAASRDALREAQAKLGSLENKHAGGQAQLASSRAESRKALATYEDSARNAGRMEKLFAKGYASQREYDSSTTSEQEAKAALAASKANIREGAARLDELASDIKVQERALDTLRAQIDEAKANVGFYKAKLDDTRIISPINGVVVYRAFRPGETVPPDTTVLTVVDPQDKWVRIDLDETLLGRIRPGQRLEIRAAGLMRQVLTGTVFDIGREAGFATQRDVTRGKQDIRTFRVKIRVADPQDLLKPGMTAIVRIP